MTLSWVWVWVWDWAWVWVWVYVYTVRQGWGTSPYGQYASMPARSGGGSGDSHQSGDGHTNMNNY